MKFEVPLFFKNSIEADPNINNCVTGGLANLFPWFQDNKLYFFPEFTDHGVDHINTVLATANSLLTSEARKIFTPSDSGALILSILLHDCAMHLSWDGFQTLLSGEYFSESSFYENQEKPWPDLFNSFMHDAKRWDQEKLIQVLGEARQIRFPPTSIVDATEVDRRLIGEFLRIHHARLAHEIAILGVPGPLSNRENWIKPISTLALPADLLGFIARSHNLSLRSAKDRLPRHRQRSYQSIHAPYIMAILRVADYLQIQSKRAHPSLLSIRSLQSSISINEWNKHASTTDIHQNGDDPEALVVHCEPSNINTLFALKSLFESMQQELDNTWATLGEVYGGDAYLHPFAFKGLSIRRIQTNINNLAQYEKQENPQFVPIELQLKSAGADMFNLLVGPLYNGNASVAIREMIQNSVDACAERTEYIKSIGTTDSPMKIQVTLSLNKEKQSSFLCIRDNGIGMHLNTIKDYFLVAGASFRKSQWWKSHFMDSEGNSSVQRSGRFGVGALATFLVGDKTTVTTRHADDKSGKGLTFTYSIDDNFIEARRVTAEIGTEIKIEITSKKILNYFHNNTQTDKARYHWYGLNNPSIEFTIIKENSSPKNVNCNFKIPNVNEILPTDWFEIKPEGYQSVHWSFLKVAPTDYPRNPIFCNGIYIAEHWTTNPNLEISPGSPSINLTYPTLSIFDSNGNFPLNLARNSLASEALPFQEILETSIADYVVNKITKQWDKRKTPTRDSSRNFNVPGLKTNRSIITGICARFKHGACLLDKNLLSTLNFEKILIIPSSLATIKKEVVEKILSLEGVLVLESNLSLSTKGDVENFFRTIMNPEARDINFLKSLGRKIIGTSIHASTNSLIIAKEKGRVPKYYFSNWHSKIIDENYSILTTQKETGEPLDNYQYLLGANGFFAEFLFSNEKKEEVKETHLSLAWKRFGNKTAILTN